MPAMAAGDGNKFKMRASGIHYNRHLGTPAWQGVLLLLLAVLVYIHGLGGQYVPTIGDEMVYAHIARLTAESGQWLPLASELPGTRNTKPPLLFWQAMLAGDWGRHWSLAALRSPSLLYTLVLASLIAACALRITRRWSDALLAACLYLAFFSTFRFGRPYLTSAPETFWLSLPLLALLWQRLGNQDNSPGWRGHFVAGLCMGLGLGYKSFALIAPAAAAWWLALLWSEPRLTWSLFLRHTVLSCLSAAVALAVFALWFVLDPHPAEVWQEFVVAENASKFSDARGYWQEALGLHGSSLWSQLLAYPINAGLLFFIVLGLGWQGLRLLPRLGRRPAPHHAILLAWALIWLLVFLLPSQRSARYVIPAMPAIALWLTLYWREIPRFWFVPTLILALPLYFLLGRIAWVGHSLGLFADHELALTLLVLTAGVLCALLSLFWAAWMRTASLCSCFLVYAAWGLFVAPMEGSIGQFSPQSQGQLSAGSLAVPNNFNGQFERYRFLLPTAQSMVPYDVDARAPGKQGFAGNLMTPQQELESLLSKHAAVIWNQSRYDEAKPPCLSNCQVLGERWTLRSRYLSGEISSDNLWYPQHWLFRREWLITRSHPN